MQGAHSSPRALFLGLNKLISRTFLDLFDFVFRDSRIDNESSPVRFSKEFASLRMRTSPSARD
jgi:hypothetical protein